MLQNEKLNKNTTQAPLAEVIHGGLAGIPSVSRYTSAIVIYIIDLSGIEIGRRTITRYIRKQHNFRFDSEKVDDGPTIHRFVMYLQIMHTDFFIYKLPYTY